MVEYWRKNPEGECPVLFLHVPGASDEVHIEKGKQVTLGLIAALAELKT